MKAISNYMNGAVNDAKTVVPALKDAFVRLNCQYNEQTHPKLRILDSLIFISLSTFVIQLAYMFVVRSKEPLNALMAGCFCSLGQFALAGKFPNLFLPMLIFILTILIASLRIQLSDNSYQHYSNKKSIIEFMVASFLLYLSSFTLIN